MSSRRAGVEELVAAASAAAPRANPTAVARRRAAALRLVAALGGAFRALAVARVARRLSPGAGCGAGATGVGAGMLFFAWPGGGLLFFTCPRGVLFFAWPGGGLLFFAWPGGGLLFFAWPGDEGFAVAGDARSRHSRTAPIRAGTRCDRRQGGATVTNVLIRKRMTREYVHSALLSTNARDETLNPRFSNVPFVPSEVLAIPCGPTGLAEGRGFIDQALSVAGFDAATRYQITVATNEAVSNAMEHGVPCDDGLFHLAATIENGSFVFSVRDCGAFVESGSRELDPVAERGRGFACMNLLMDDVRLDARSGETVLRLAKRLPGTERPERETEPAVGERNLEVVRELFRAFAARDIPSTIRLIDRGVMIEPMSTAVQRRTPYLGVAGLRRYLQDLDETWQEFRINVDDLLAEGDHVIANGRIRARQHKVIADDAAAFVFKLREAKIVWLKVYRSHEEALAAAGVSRGDWI